MPIDRASLLYYCVQVWRAFCHVFKQGRTQEFVPGGGARLSTIFERKRKRGREAPERGEGVGGGVSPLPHPGSFCIFEIEIGRSGAHLGWIFWGENLNKKIRRKYIFMENVCFLH